MMIKKNKLRAIILMAFMTMSISGFAQDEDPPVDDGGADDFPPTPIDDYVIPMIILGAATGYLLIRKRTM